MAKFIQKAIKHPGRLTAAAHRAGVSVREEARKWAHSADASKRGAGILAERFEHGDLHKKKKKRIGKSKEERVKAMTDALR